MSAESRIRELVRENLADDHQVDGVRFIDELLRLAAEVGGVRCTLAGDHGLRFQAPNQPAWEVEVGRARTKLRMLCARLGVLCNEAGGPEVSLYGGEGTIRPDARAADGAAANGPYPRQPARADVLQGRPDRWAVRFKNTPSEQEFTIVAE